MIFMSLYVKPLDVHCDASDLDFLREYILNFHYKNKNTILSNFDPGNTIHKSQLGYYIPQFNITHTTRKVSSWVEFNEQLIDDLCIHTIKMNQDNCTYQNLYVIKSPSFLDDAYLTVLNRVLDRVYRCIAFDRSSTSATVQEFGYSMKFHTDAGVESRIHINLNRNSLDYFYTGTNGMHRWHFGECCLVEASKVNHGFMSFQQEPRIHLIMDII